MIDALILNLDVVVILLAEASIHAGFGVPYQ